MTRVTANDMARLDEELAAAKLAEYANPNRHTKRHAKLARERYEAASAEYFGIPLDEDGQ